MMDMYVHAIGGRAEGKVIVSIVLSPAPSSILLLNPALLMSEQSYPFLKSLIHTSY